MSWKEGKQTKQGMRRAPIPFKVWQACLGVIFALAAQTPGDEGFELFGAGLVFWAAFLGLLRPCEFRALGRETLLLSTDFAESASWVIAIIDNPKTRKVFGWRQFSLIKSELLPLWITWLLAARPGKTRLFNGSPQKLTEILRNALKILGLDSSGYTLSCFRAGGATHAYMTCPQALPQLQFQGRWKALPTMHHYLQTAAVALKLAQIPVPARPAVEAMADFFVKLKPPV